MERRLLRALILRGALVALPFVAWFIWRAWARRTGREMGSTPYPWLFAAGALLVGISLIATVLFHRDNRGQRYVPGEVTADGRVTEGRFEQRAPPRR
jgi:TRAP-type C4-dicarboxylate transport system permease small subunit